MAMTAEQLQALWIQAGGNPQNAAIAAAVAMAESSGNPDASHQNSNGSIDRGLWQINSVHGTLSSTDPLANAKAAVSISNNGATWMPWCTAYSDGACGSKGGSYSPTSGSPVAKFLGPLSGPAGAAPGVANATNPISGMLPSDPLGIGAVVNGVEGNMAMSANVILNNLFYATLAFLGIGALIVGAILLMRETPVGSTLGAIKAVIK